MAFYSAVLIVAAGLLVAPLRARAGSHSWSMLAVSVGFGCVALISPASSVCLFAAALLVHVLADPSRLPDRWAPLPLALAGLVFVMLIPGVSRLLGLTESVRAVLGNAGTSDGSPLVLVGWSFFLFRAIAYVADCRTGRWTPFSSGWQTVAFLTFFPSLVSGPIGRASDFDVMVAQEESLGRSVLSASTQITLGFFTKFVLGDRFMIVSDSLFRHPEWYSASSLWVGLLAYTLGIYCDFAGYSAIAIGAGRIAGVRLRQNFRLPYLADSIADFWRRWHVSLSDWLRDYVFLPMAYRLSRATEDWKTSRRMADLAVYAASAMITMLVAGLWHGVGPGFVLWGALHGLALCAQRLWQYKTRGRFRLPALAYRGLTLGFVCLAWIPFKFGVSPATASVVRLLAVPHGGVCWIPLWFLLGVALLVGGHLLHEILRRGRERSVPASVTLTCRLLARCGLALETHKLSGEAVIVSKPSVFGIWLLVTLGGLAILLSPGGPGPFIYERF